MEQKKFIYTFTKEELVYIYKKQFINLKVKNKKFIEKQALKNEMLRGERILTINSNSFEIDNLISVSFDDLMEARYENKILMLKFITGVWISIPERAFNDINDVELLFKELSDIAKNNVEQEELNPRYYDIADEIVVDSILEYSQYEYLMSVEKNLLKSSNLKRNYFKRRILFIIYVLVLTIISIGSTVYSFISGDSLVFPQILIYIIGFVVLIYIYRFIQDYRLNKIRKNNIGQYDRYRIIFKENEVETLYKDELKTYQYKDLQATILKGSDYILKFKGETTEEIVFVSLLKKPEYMIQGIKNKVSRFEKKETKGKNKYKKWNIATLVIVIIFMFIGTSPISFIKSTMPNTYKTMTIARNNNIFMKMIKSMAKEEGLPILNSYQITSYSGQKYGLTANKNSIISISYSLNNSYTPLPSDICEGINFNNEKNEFVAVFNKEHKLMAIIKPTGNEKIVDTPNVLKDILNGAKNVSSGYEI